MFDSNGGKNIFTKIHHFFNMNSETTVIENIKIVSDYIMWHFNCNGGYVTCEHFLFF